MPIKIGVPTAPNETGLESAISGITTAAIGGKPIATNNGRDTQLERAIAEVMQQLEAWQDPIPSSAPAYPTELGQ